MDSSKRIKRISFHSKEQFQINEMVSINFFMTEAVII